MISDLAQAIAAALRDVRLTSTNTAKIRQKLTALAADPLLPSLDLRQAREISRHYGNTVDDLIRDMTLAQLKKLSKAWNPHRKIPKDVIMRDLQIEIRELVAEQRSPDPAPQRSARAKSVHRIAAE